jgi:exodeoxyribonuclease VIII
MKGEIKQLSMPDYQKAPGLSQSTLKVIGRSPAHFQYALKHPKEPTRDMLLGTVAHTAILEPSLLKGSYHLRPNTYKNEKGEDKKWNANANACKAWLEAHKDKIILTSEEQDAMLGMRKSAMENPTTHAMFKEGAAETCIFAQDPEFNVRLKCRIDWLSGDAIVEVKTTDDARPEAFARVMFNKGYDIQAAYNLDLAALVGIRKEWFVFAVFERDPPYAVATYYLSAEAIESARMRYRRMLATADYCFKQNEWPGYDSGIKQIAPPMWAQKQSLELLYE